LYEEARARFYRGELTHADSLFKEVAQRYPKGIHVNDALEFSILINTNSDTPDVVAEYATARHRLRTREPEEAIAILERLRSEHEVALIRDEALLLLGQALRDAGRPDEALRALAQAVEEAQVMDLAADARLLRARILARDLRDPARALAEYEELLVTYPETLAADRARDLSAELSRALP
jgi:outer membrane protein assembly factor BamD (BamD/ComL family)